MGCRRCNTGGDKKNCVALKKILVWKMCYNMKKADEGFVNYGTIYFNVWIR